MVDRIPLGYGILIAQKWKHFVAVPKSLRAGPGWCVVSVPLSSGPNTESNPGEGRVLNKKIKNKKIRYLRCFNIRTKKKMRKR